MRLEDNEFPAVANFGYLFNHALKLAQLGFCLLCWFSGMEWACSLKPVAAWIRTSVSTTSLLKACKRPGKNLHKDATG